MSDLSTDESAISAAWLEAGRELGIAVASPYELSWNGRVYLYPALLTQFGNPKGTLIVAWRSIDEDDRSSAAREAGFFNSVVNPELYNSYQRERFVDTLNDLGWFGPSSQAPLWYTGAPWED